MTVDGDMYVFSQQHSQHKSPTPNPQFIKHLAQYETHLPHPLSLFVPDLPGYGASAPIKTNDKLSVGTVLLSALKTEVRRSSTITATSPIPVILVGHDRGARVAHRLAVSGCEGMDIKGVCLIDIVGLQPLHQSLLSYPTREQLTTQNRSQQQPNGPPSQIPKTQQAHFTGRSSPTSPKPTPCSPPTAAPAGATT